MRLTNALTQIRSSALAAGVAITIMAAAGAAQATSVLHEGTILQFPNLGGVGFSSIHLSKNGNGSGAGRGSIGGSVLYDWNVIPNPGPSGPSFTTGTTATFNVADLEIFEKQDGSDRFTLTLLASPTSILTVGDELDTFKEVGGRTISHSIGGLLDFRIDHFSSAGSTEVLIGQAFDTFEFDNDILMGPVNGVAEIGISAVEIFLWGDTGDRLFDCTGDCTSIASEYFPTGKKAKYGLGIDLAFNGSVSAVPLPAALPLLMTGLAGMAFISRRRLKRDDA